MGLLQTLGLRKKKNSDEIKRLVDTQSELIGILTKQLEAERLSTKVFDDFKPEPKPETEDFDEPKSSKPRFHKSMVEAGLTEWFNRRSNKWLTKTQMQTMPSSPVKGIANSSFYRFLGDTSVFEINNSRRPIRYRLKEATPTVPPVPALYGTSLTVINQQLRGTKTPITLHRTDCSWHKKKGGEWLYDLTVPELRRKIKKLFATYANGRAPVIKRCTICVKAGRLQTK